MQYDYNSMVCREHVTCTVLQPKCNSLNLAETYSYSFQQRTSYIGETLFSYITYHLYLTCSCFNFILDQTKILELLNLHVPVCQDLIQLLWSFIFRYYSYLFYLVSQKEVHACPRNTFINDLPQCFRSANPLNLLPHTLTSIQSLCELLNTSITQSSASYKLSHVRPYNQSNVSNPFYFCRLPHLQNSFPHVDIILPTSTLKKVITEFLWNYFTANLDPTSTILLSLLFKDTSPSHLCSYHFFMHMINYLIILYLAK